MLLLLRLCLGPGVGKGRSNISQIYPGRSTGCYVESRGAVCGQLESVEASQGSAGDEDDMVHALGRDIECAEGEGEGEGEGEWAECRTSTASPGRVRKSIYSECLSSASRNACYGYQWIQIVLSKWSAICFLYILSISSELHFWCMALVSMCRAVSMWLPSCPLRRESQMKRCGASRCWGK